MLRPIDTQTIYQQSQEVSNRQQTVKNEAEVQQNQFGNILHKETIEKQQSVGEIKEEEEIKNHLDKEHKKHEAEQQRKYKKKKKKNMKGETKDNTHHIDIRI